MRAYRRTTTVAALALALAATLALTGCGSDDASTTGIVTFPPATPAASPPSGQITGRVVEAPAGTAVAVSHGTVATLAADGKTVQLYAAPAGEVPAVSVAVPELTTLIAHGDGFAGVGPDGVLLIGTDGALTPVGGPIDSPLALAFAGDDPLVGTAQGSLLVLDDRGAKVREIGGFVRVDQVTVSPVDVDGVRQVVVLDQAQSLLVPIDTATGERRAALRAGNGATHLAVDGYGRVLAAGTRDNELLGFYGQPIVMRFRFPVPDSPYALAVDDTHDRAWVSATATNEALAFRLSSGMPEETARVGTVGQVAAAAVDPADGTLYLLSGRGDGLQVVPAPQSS